MDNETIESTISELVSITNNAKIYGSTRILGTNSMQTDEVADLLNRALTAIHTLQREVKIRQLETDQNYVTLIVLSDGTFMDVADAKMILVKAEQYEEVCNLGGSGHDFNPLASIDLSNLNIIPNFA